MILHNKYSCYSFTFHWDDKSTAVTSPDQTKMRADESPSVEDCLYKPIVVLTLNAPGQIRMRVEESLIDFHWLTLKFKPVQSWWECMRFGSQTKAKESYDCLMRILLKLRAVWSDAQRFKVCCRIYRACYACICTRNVYCRLIHAKQRYSV